MSDTLSPEPPLHLALVAQQLTEAAQQLPEPHHTDLFGIALKLHLVGQTLTLAQGEADEDELRREIEQLQARIADWLPDLPALAAINLLVGVQSALQAWLATGRWDTPLPAATEMPSIGTVFGLADPRDGRMRYVGSVAGRVRGERDLPRMMDTLPQAASFAVRAWMEELVDIDRAPHIWVLEEVPLAHLEKRCLHWLAVLRSQGVALLNAPSEIL